MKFEYKLVKWLDEGGNKELPVTIQEEAIEDFCELVEWDKEEFYGNTIRYPLGEEEEEEIVLESEPLQKRTRRTKIVTPNKKGPQRKYPDEMRGFIERHLNSNNNQQICDLINEKWDVEITKQKLAAYMAYKKLKREKKIVERKENISNSKAKTSIEKFVEKSKITDPLLLRDAIIEKFEENCTMADLNRMINDRENNSSGESVREEVKRVTKKRTDDDLDDDVDSMGLDY